MTTQIQSPECQGAAAAMAGHLNGTSRIRDPFDIPYPIDC